MICIRRVKYANPAVYQALALWFSQNVTMRPKAGHCDELDVRYLVQSQLDVRLIRRVVHEGKITSKYYSVDAKLLDVDFPSRRCGQKLLWA